LLAAESPPYIPIFQVTNSCTGVGAIFSPEASAHVIHDPVPSPTAKYAAIYNANGTTTPCTLGSEGATVDVGESDIFESSCSTDYELTSSIGEAFGPIQAIVFA